MKKLVFLTCLLLSISTVACGSKDSQATPSTVTEEKEGESSGSRLEELQKESAEAAEKVNKEKQEAQAKKDQEEAERQAKRDAVTTNGELLDALVGYWGFVSPAYYVKETGYTTKAKFVYFYFSENGNGFLIKGYDGDREKLYLETIRNTKFAFDEENQMIYVFYPHDEDSKDYSNSNYFSYTYEDGNLKLYGDYYLDPSYSRDTNNELVDVEYHKGDWQQFLDDVEKNDSINKTSEDYPNFVSIHDH